jgi:hypothetical protein
LLTDVHEVATQQGVHGGKQQQQSPHALDARWRQQSALDDVPQLSFKQKETTQLEHLVAVHALRALEQQQRLQPRPVDAAQHTRQLRALDGVHAVGSENGLGGQRRHGVVRSMHEGQRGARRHGNEGALCPNDTAARGAASPGSCAATSAAVSRAATCCRCCSAAATAPASAGTLSRRPVEEVQFQRRVHVPARRLQQLRCPCHSACNSNTSGCRHQSPRC